MRNTVQIREVTHAFIPTTLERALRQFDMFDNPIFRQTMRDGRVLLTYRDESHGCFRPMAREIANYVQPFPEGRLPR